MDPRARPLRILHLYPKADYFTGAAIQLGELARGLRARGHEVRVVTRPSATWAEKLRAAAVAHDALPMAWEADVRSALGIARLVRRHQPDVVHAHKGLARTLAILAGIVVPIPVLVLNRGVSFPVGRLRRLGYSTRRVTAIVAVCASIREGLVAAGVDPAKVHVVYSGTDTDRFHPGVDGGPIRRALGLGAEDFLVTQIGVRSIRGNDDVIAAMGLVARAADRAHLLVVGARRADTLRERGQARGLDGRLHVWGYREDIPEILAASDLCVDGSWAGLGLTGALREALAVETAVVATAIEGNPELVRDGETGLLVPPRAPAALAAAILRMAGDPALRQATARAGRKLVEVAFSTRVKLDATEALYRRLVSAREPA